LGSAIKLNRDDHIRSKCLHCAVNIKNITVNLLAKNMQSSKNIGLCNNLFLFLRSIYTYFPAVPTIWYFSCLVCVKWRKARVFAQLQDVLLGELHSTCLLFFSRRLQRVAGFTKREGTATGDSRETRQVDDSTRGQYSFFMPDVNKSFERSRLRYFLEPKNLLCKYNNASCGKCKLISFDAFDGGTKLLRIIVRKIWWTAKSTSFCQTWGSRNRLQSTPVIE